ncbi:uncharacterized protein LY79DRAFT_209712 [Colletotrichum navitas]|uniref:Uncharacterized protein n=1 Tax=Colletotrichum navitas TaxID=681940 RepID=A0AAD8QDP1_9PEZI|nr:uncharacterized protein LY79DRAFT_209712 [Colletotrichum navitas]KAK1599144.1 hypothetical protein LY79DRAFT_209712 [Colletotrichum navitas]
MSSSLSWEPEDGLLFSPRRRKIGRAKRMRLPWGTLVTAGTRGARCGTWRRTGFHARSHVAFWSCSLSALPACIRLAAPRKKGGRLSSGHPRHGNLVPAGGWESWSVVARLLGAWGVCAAVIVFGRPACEIVAVKGVGVLHACPGLLLGDIEVPPFSPALLSCCANRAGSQEAEMDKKKMRR